ncbi:hypothetical protein [Pseudonocardia oroxyli]|nr:hypothetical protein [Pseudonocardia oroxyli]
MDTATRIEAAADELYGVPPEDFVPVRDELVAEAKAADDKEAAKAIGRLRRPNQAAWLANLLARERGDQLDALLDLAGELNSAQRALDGAQLRALSAQRSKLVGAMAREARRIAAADGHRVTESVERDLRGILDAALADPDIADEVRSGRLTRTVSWSGFGPEAGASSLGGRAAARPGTREPREPRTARTPRRPAPGRPGQGLPGVEPRRGRRTVGPGEPGDDVLETPETTESPSDAPSDRESDTESDTESEAERRERERAERAEAERRQRERAAAEEAVAESRRTAERAADAHEDATATLRDAESERDDAGARVEQLTAELDRAREARTAAQSAVKDAARAEREASRAARDAAAALAKAEALLDSLQ